jgi:hypothetical protein
MSPFLHELAPKTPKLSGQRRRLTRHLTCFTSECLCRDYPGKFYDLTHSSPRLRFFGTPVSAASIPSVSSDGIKLGLKHKTSKMTSGSVAARASAPGQTPRGGSFSYGARIKGRKRFRYPKRSTSCIQQPAHLAVS